MQITKIILDSIPKDVIIELCLYIIGAFSGFVLLCVGVCTRIALKYISKWNQCCDDIIAIKAVCAERCKRRK